MNPTSRTHFPLSFQAVARSVAIVVAGAARAAIPGVLWVALAAFAPSPSQAEHWPNRILYFTHSAGYRHEVIPTSRAVLKQLGETSRAFKVTTTEDVSAFTAENLRHYAAVMFFTTGELPMTDAQKAALLAFVRSGRGFLGVHSATDTFYMWPEYGKLIGGYFNEHPWHEKVTVDVADPAGPLVGFLAPSFAVNDEIYQIRDFDPQTSRILLRLDPASVDLAAPNVHRQDYGWPLAWTRSYGRGHVFYTALGHEEAVWRDPRYQRMLTNAILWTMRKGH
jgi:type 1 glutamine amidotransferase